ncbi:MAG: 1-acyl-sn-glycerol-3-phosphate acyltransferase [Trueperaceae bacterium]|nr:1-acyl-sn-glycerol-3-phosphate acyltransferase [Trueperaceae bacterium]
MDARPASSSARALRAQLRALTDANLGDAFEAFATRDSWLRPLLTPLLYPAARRLAEDVARCDERVAVVGVQQALRDTLTRFTGGLEPSGLHHLPAHGPLLVTANHPGLTDTLALIGTIPRSDLRIVTRDNPLLRAMPRLGAALVFLPGDPNGRRRALRELVRHLRQGGAVLIFPAGEIEPDPALYPAAATASLIRWSRSLDTFARLVPGLSVVPSLVSGTVHPSVAAHPLTYLRRRERRAWLAATLQVMFKRYQDNVVRLVYDAPLTARDGPDVGPAIQQRTARLIEALAGDAEPPPIVSPSARPLSVGRLE